MKNFLSKKMAMLGLSIAASLSAGYLTIAFEGAVTDKEGYHVVYKDPVGILTYCYGQTGRDMYGRMPKLGMKYSEQECLTMLSKTLKLFEQELDKVVNVPYKSDYQKAALIDFTYNLGISSVKSSTLLRKLNAKDHEGACDELSKWVYAKKVKLPGLVVRREEERLWCLGQVSGDVKITHLELTKMVATSSVLLNTKKE